MRGPAGGGEFEFRNQQVVGNLSEVPTSGGEFE